MEEIHIVVDVKASPLSEFSLSESSLSECSPLSELIQWKIDRGKTNEAKNFTIFRTPHNISQSRKNLFEPSVISIGPFHRGKKSLKTMEEHKWRFLESFLSRGDLSLDLCISEMKLLEETTRRCYSETFDDLDSHAFVEMMLLDGCFILEYFLKRIEGNWNSILEVGWNCHFIKLDLLLQENQIPFFIVNKLYELNGFNQDARMVFIKYIAYKLLPNDPIIADTLAEIPDRTDPDLAEIPDPPAEIPDPLAKILDLPAEITDPLAKIPDPPAEIHHLVHLYYHYLVPNPGIPVLLRYKPFDLTGMFSPNRIINGLLHWFRSRVVRGRSPHSTSRSLSVALPNSMRNLSSLVIPSATELKEAGLKFAPKSNPKHMLDISFEYGVLKIAKLEIDDSTKPIFSNLIAFEHSKYAKKHKPFTSFVTFLDNLVNTPNDVKILQECGIVENGLGSEEELTHFINQVTQGAIFDRHHYLTELYKEVNRYIGSRWHRHRAKLIRDYFSSPWTAISLIAALILIVLTCVQSFYAVYAFKYPPS